VMGDSSFPDGYWETFRQIVKTEYPDTLIIGELWQKDSTLLRYLRGDRADTTMNYRLRDAVLGLLSPGSFDSKGFGDSGRIISASEFANRIASIQEDYPEDAYFTLMNLLGSHDTERLLWALTPGSETTADKENNPANLAAGQRRQQIAALIQFTMPGAPTIYYGDEVGLTGDDDPDDRRTFPWIDTEGKANYNTMRIYRTLAILRNKFPALTAGDLRILLADNDSETVVYGRKTTSQAALVAINRSAETQTLTIPLAGYLPEGARLNSIYWAGPKRPAFSTLVRDGQIQVSLPSMSALLLATPIMDLEPPPAPLNLQVTEEGDQQVSLAWDGMGRARIRYNVYRSPVSGGGWVKINPAPLTTPTFTDTGLRNARLYYYVVTALDTRGNEGAYSNQVSALPHYQIGWANLQWPATIAHTISAVNRTPNIYGQVWIDGATSSPGPTDGLQAQVGYGPQGSNPNGNPDWLWVDTVFNVDAGNNDEFMASLLPDQTGSFDYVYRYTTTNGRDWLYADLNGPMPPATLSPNPGRLAVLPSDDASPPAVPGGLHVLVASPAGIELTWDAIEDDPTLYGYEIRRSSAAGGPYTTLALVSGATTFVDTDVVQGATYYYVLRAVDTSFNRSADSPEVAATAELRTVTLVFNVTVPAATDGTGRMVYIAGTLDRLDGGLPPWDPGGVVLTRLDETHWTLTLTGQEGVQIEYKYTLGQWDYVEKGATCEELSNRQLTLNYGSTGTQTVNDTVLNWRNVSPCGN